MQVIVSDASCLIDLRKVGLLDVLIKLPFELVIPDVIFAEELIQFTEDEISLIEESFRLGSLNGPQIERVQAIQLESPSLSLNDCFALVLAEEAPGSILMTGDSLLRIRAEESAIEVHGVLWAVGLFHRLDLCSNRRLIVAVEAWGEDPTVFLPSAGIAQILRKLKT